MTNKISRLPYSAIRLARHWAQEHESFGFSIDELNVQLRFALLYVTSFSRKTRVYDLMGDFVLGTKLRSCSLDLFSARIDSLPKSLARALSGQPASVIDQIVPRRLDRWTIAPQAAIPRELSAMKSTVYRQPLPAGTLKFRFVPLATSAASTASV